MSRDALNAVLERAMVDAAFRASLAADPLSALVGYDLTNEERSKFTAGSAGAERLEERISRTDFSAAFGGKAANADLRAVPESRAR